MRKIISLLLCLMMVLAFASFGVSAAPEGTAIKTAADFAGMTADGTYYLDADIAIVASYETKFTGTFDGNGHTITVSAPMFKDFSGTIKNLTIAGDLLGAEDLATIGVKSSEGMLAIDVTNNANVTVTGLSADLAAGLNAGGFIADTPDVAYTCTFRRCVNNGKITIETADEKDATTGSQYETHVGGFVGRANGFDAKFCENNGEITALSNRGQAAGFIGRSNYTAKFQFAYFDDCVNTGKITSGYDAAGFVAYIGVASNAIGIPYSFNCSVSTGDVTGGYRVGGFIGYCYATGSNSNEYFAITNSLVNATVTVGRAATDKAGTAQVSFGSLFVGYSNSMANTITDSLAFGEVKAAEGENMNVPYICILGCSSASTKDMEVKSVYLCDNNTTQWYSYATADTNAAQRIELSWALTEAKVIRCTEAEITNGTVCKAVNESAGSEVWVQKLGTDNFPQINSVLREERIKEDEYIGEKEAETTADPAKETTKAPAKETTKAPEAATTATPAGSNTPAGTTAAPDTTAAKKESGCGKSASALVLAAVIILGSATFVIGKKH